MACLLRFDSAAEMFAAFHNRQLQACEANGMQLAELPTLKGQRTCDIVRVLTPLRDFYHAAREVCQRVVAAAAAARSQPPAGDDSPKAPNNFVGAELDAEDPRRNPRALLVCGALVCLLSRYGHRCIYSHCAECGCFTCDGAAGRACR